MLRSVADASSLETLLATEEMAPATVEEAPSRTLDAEAEAEASSLEIEAETLPRALDAEAEALPRTLDALSPAEEVAEATGATPVKVVTVPSAMVVVMVATPPTTELAGAPAAEEDWSTAGGLQRA